MLAVVSDIRSYATGLESSSCITEIPMDNVVELQSLGTVTLRL